MPIQPRGNDRMTVRLEGARVTFNRHAFQWLALPESCGWVLERLLSVGGHESESLRHEPLEACGLRFPMRCSADPLLSQTRRVGVNTARQTSVRTESSDAYLKLMCAGARFFRANLRVQTFGVVNSDGDSAHRAPAITEWTTPKGCNPALWS